GRESEPVTWVYGHLAACQSAPVDRPERQQRDLNGRGVEPFGQQLVGELLKVGPAQVGEPDAAEPREDANSYRRLVGAQRGRLVGVAGAVAHRAGQRGLVPLVPGLADGDGASDAQPATANRSERVRAP